MSASRRRGPPRLDPYAAAWGGVIGCVGLLAGSGLDSLLRFVIVGVVFWVAGIAAGLRAPSDRQFNATAAWVAAHLLALAFVLLSAIVGYLGGPGAPSPTPGGAAATITTALIALFAALLGAVLTDRWLRPRGGGYGSKLR